MAEVKKKTTVKKTENKTGDLREQIKKAREELFTLQLDHGQRKIKNTSSLTTKRKEIAKLLTALRQVELTQ